MKALKSTAKLLIGTSAPNSGLNSGWLRGF
jgi:hypothetical protein